MKQYFLFFSFLLLLPLLTGEGLSVQARDANATIENNYPVLACKKSAITVHVLENGGDEPVVKHQNTYLPVKEHPDCNCPCCSTEKTDLSNTCIEHSKAEADPDEDQEYAFLGVYSSTLSREKANALGFDNPYGSYITKIIPNTAAERAKLKPFDYIYGVDEFRTGEHQSLTHILRKYRPDEKGLLQVIRKEKKISLRVSFGRREDSRRKEISKCEEPFFGIRNAPDACNNGIPVNIVDNSTAEALEMKDGDIILQINDYPMIDWEDIGTAIDNMTVGDEIKVFFERNGTQYIKKGPIRSYCETKPIHQEREFVIELREHEKKIEGIIEKNKEDYDFNFDFGNEKAIIAIEKGGSSEVDLSSADIRINEVNAREMEALKRRHQLFSNNDLRVENLKLQRKKDNKNLAELTFDLPNRGNTIVRIFNPDGRSIYEYDLGSFSGDFSDFVDISQNGEGEYFLSIEQGSKAKMKKIVVRQ